MDLRKSKVEASTTVPGSGGKNVGPGQLVDLDEIVAPGFAVRDLFPIEWFEEAEKKAAVPESKKAKKSDE